MSTNEDIQLKEPNKVNEEVDDVTKIKFFGGHEYDGIKELDNPLPPWLKYLFYVTIIFSISYLILLFVFKDDSIIQVKEYRKEVMAARAKTEVAVKEEAVKTAAAPMTEEQILAAGKAIYDKTCLVCHGKFGEGLVGPNFTDEYWIHGGKPEDLLKVINEGVLEKGMISYKSQMNNTQIDHVIGYILSLQGSNPPNQKAPQGVKN
ncbi:MAG: cbb3-type cytochrome c oxidase N-terminal domain-containing protein [Bacteroidota bacterium]|nr:cbb3-type cytochrome c oxidase N-terminal domain-containing protein [Bacteroidota bacterium]